MPCFVLATDETHGRKVVKVKLNCVVCDRETDHHLIAGENKSYMICLECEQEIMPSELCRIIGCAWSFCSTYTRHYRDGRIAHGEAQECLRCSKRRQIVN